MSTATERADTIQRLLNDEVVQDVLADMKQDAYTDFLRATNDDQRRAAHAFAQGIARLETAFQAVVDAGERERMDAESADRRLATR